MIGRRLLIKGKVQGVFYRAWTEQNARALGLSGWVRNLRSGDVEVVVTGPDELIDDLIRRCWHGPPAAKVSDIQVEPVEAEPLSGFFVRPTG
jgi:acylphosphatase